MPSIMEQMIEVVPVHISKLELKPGDTLVIRADYGPIVEKESWDQYVSGIHAVLPEGSHVVFLPQDAELSIIPKEPIP